MGFGTQWFLSGHWGKNELSNYQFFFTNCESQLLKQLKTEKKTLYRFLFERYRLLKSRYLVQKKYPPKN